MGPLMTVDTLPSLGPLGPMRRKNLDSDASCREPWVPSTAEGAVASWQRCSQSQPRDCHTLAANVPGPPRPGQGLVRDAIARLGWVGGWADGKLATERALTQQRHTILLPWRIRWHGRPPALQPLIIRSLACVVLARAWCCAAWWHRGEIQSSASRPFIRSAT